MLLPAETAFTSCCLRHMTDPSVTVSTPTETVPITGLWSGVLVFSHMPGCVS